MLDSLIEALGTYEPLYVGLIGIVILLAGLFLILPYCAIIAAIVMQILRGNLQELLGKKGPMHIGGQDARRATRMGLMRLASKDAPPALSKAARKKLHMSKAVRKAGFAMPVATLDSAE